MLKKKGIAVLLISFILVISSLPAMAASGSDTAYGTINGESCTGTLTYGDRSGTAVSKCPTVALYRKSTAISILYITDYSGMQGYEGNSAAVYNTTSACSVVASLNSYQTSLSATGSHSFEASNGYVRNLETYA